MTLAETIQYLRTGVVVQDPIDPNTGADPAFLSLTDDQLTLIISVGVSKEMPGCTNIAYVPDSNLYGALLLIRKELYYTLAVYSAPKYDISAEEIAIKKGQRFNHYYQLIQQIDKEYQNYLENGGGSGTIDGNSINSLGTLQSVDVLLESRQFSQRYKDLGIKPIVSAFVSEITDTSALLDWSVYNLRHYVSTWIYISTSRIILPYLDTISIDPLEKHSNINRLSTMFLNLLPDTTYYAAVVVNTKSGISGRIETSFHTAVAQ